MPLTHHSSAAMTMMSSWALVCTLPTENLCTCSTGCWYGAPLSCLPHPPFLPPQAHHPSFLTSTSALHPLPEHSWNTGKVPRLHVCLVVWALITSCSREWSKLEAVKHLYKLLNPLTVNAECVGRVGRTHYFAKTIHFIQYLLEGIVFVWHCPGDVI